MSENLSNLAEAANAAMADKAPEIGVPFNNEVSLVRGLFNSATGDWETKATVRELTGEDEEALASFTAKDDLSYGQYIVFLLKRAVTTIGTQSITDNPHLIDDLILGDRDALFLGAIKATYGKTRQVQMVCGNCGETNDVTLDLEEDFKVNKTDADLTKPIQVKLKDGSTKSFNYPTTGDSVYAVKKSKNLAEQNTYIIARCLIADMGREEREFWAKKLGLSDRQKIVKAITSVQPGPKMEEVNTQCAHCDQELAVVLDWVSLLLG